MRTNYDADYMQALRDIRQAEQRLRTLERKMTEDRRIPQPDGTWNQAKLRRLQKHLRTLREAVHQNG